MVTLVGISAVFIFITWIGYPLFLHGLLMCFCEKGKNDAKWNQRKKLLSVIIAAHNEENVIEKRINSILSQMPVDFDLEIIVMSDHSSDKTVILVNNISTKDQRVKIYEVASVKGRAAAHNQAVQYANGSILVFTDADTDFCSDFLDAIGHAYDNPKVGFASGELFWREDANSETGNNVSLYWRFEIWLRRMESRLGILATGTGACCSVRKELFAQLPLTSDVDFATPIDVVLQGYIAVIIGEAKAFDNAATSVIGEFTSRSRMTAKNFHGTLKHFGWKGMVAKPFVGIAIFFHKICRWLTPFFTIIIMGIGTSLSVLPNTNLLIILFVSLGWVSISIALIGSLNPRLPVAGSLWLFMVVNAAFANGVLKAIFNRVPVQYEKTQ